MGKKINDGAATPQVRVKLNAGVVHTHAGTTYRDQAEISMDAGHATWLVEACQRARYVTDVATTDDSDE